MTKLIDLTYEREKKTLTKKVVRVEFKRDVAPELFLEESFTIDHGININIKNINLDMNIATLKECPYDAGFDIALTKGSDKEIFLDYAESLDLYLLLHSLYGKADGISSIATIAEE